MIRALVDTNILIDFLAQRKPFFADARKLMVFAYMGDYELWASSSQMTDLFYILSHGGRESEAAPAKRALRALRQNVHVYAPDEDDIDCALASDWDDFEDSLVYQAAVKIGARLIVTRNADDFAASTVKAVSPAEFFAWMEKFGRRAYAEIDF